MHHCKMIFGYPTILAALLLAASDSPAAVLIFKDGFTIVGKVNREGSVIIEAGQIVKVGNGFWVVDDDQTLPERKNFYIRRIVFSFRQVPPEGIDDKVLNKDTRVVTLRNSLTPLSTATRIEPFGPILGATPWDTNWERTFEFKPLKKPAMTTKQRITLMTPYAVCVESSRFLWQQMYLTRELGPETVRQLLYSHPDLRERVGEVDPEKRSKIVKFLLQAGFSDAAELELDLWVKEGGGRHKKEIDELRAFLQPIRAQEIVDALERAHRGGQHDWVRKQLAKFPQQGAEEKHLRRIRDFERQYEEGDDALKAARRFLKELPPRCSPESHQTLFADAAAAILRELNLDTYPKLERFIAFARQEEREREQKKKSTYSPGDLMGLAVSGWLLGNASAEPKAETGVRLWRARLFVQQYQKTDSPTAREKLLADYERNSTDAIPFDEMAQLISMLPPPYPEEKLPANGLLPLETKLPGERRGSSYVLQLPRDYHHGRPYPLIIVCHQAGEMPGDAIDRWGRLAYEQGFVVAAPEWSGKSYADALYDFSAETHQVVLNTLRDIQRRFNIDSDRVFLAGAGQGGDMVYDIGLSHPDLFAGAVVVGAYPRFYAKSYAINGQFLPFYVVCGELASDAPKVIREQFRNYWIPNGTPSIYVEYKGRGQEWFAGEMPSIFDWMNRKRRAMPLPATGTFVSMRPTDNRFYWLSGEGINPQCINDIANWNPLQSTASLRGKIGDSNTVYLHAANYQKVTLWLTRGMLELEKPVTVLLNTTTVLNQRQIRPNLGVLLEDFYHRGDRQRQFIARIDLAGR